MNWSNDAPPRFILQIERSVSGGAGRERSQRKLLADTLEDAKLEAAILYACSDLASVPPGYRIVKGARRVVYRYPETKARTGEVGRPAGGLRHP